MLFPFSGHCPLEVIWLTLSFLRELFARFHFAAVVAVQTTASASAAQSPITAVDRCIEHPLAFTFTFAHLLSRLEITSLVLLLLLLLLQEQRVQLEAKLT